VYVNMLGLGIGGILLGGDLEREENRDKIDIGY
jgi:hypothetical protein